ncbi:superoxide dismutase family protein [Pseudoxanthomonas winnipegensis]|uniref:Superoxide dismutase family protein n=1 Tax=Pseudoxanthomonas winnipegensis TaxID=2480810 RepID=A0A4Q8LBP2_9GAMM|nr:superoxide dismutase family protein [Pseudoxanthomonas winnipegensis]RZZ83215.1 superoxide dismutase family protein [Pseudoxanthomonas winnipegensis]TAA26190.1 superoxide dismutase family protein [Pseudoxanthomonas winnipegensis]TAA39896.1 superoxide dismutase family protein [Pseudoxanthomonas winnipegensis]TBV72634.1 superoxide dismutase family protein [Pseudoxanthomonas winnipegensis]
MPHHRFHRLLLPALASGAALALSACSSAPAPKPAPPVVVPAQATVHDAQAIMRSASASLVSGKLTLSPVAGGVRIAGTIGGLPPSGRFGFHVHEVGDCSAVDASSAGGHFNPTHQPHGNAKIGAHHAGDMDNLTSDLEGVARVDTRLGEVTLGGGAPNDILGRALVVHADPDDYATQPAGKSGARVACGVIQAIR